MNGFEVARRARAAGNYVPILILTAKDDARGPSCAASRRAPTTT